MYSYLTIVVKIQLLCSIAVDRSTHFLIFIFLLSSIPSYFLETANSYRHMVVRPSENSRSVKDTTRRRLYDSVFCMESDDNNDDDDDDNYRLSDYENLSSVDNDNNDDDRSEHKQSPPTADRTMATTNK